MTDIASLGLEVNTTQVTQGATELDKLDAAGKRVGVTMDSLKNTTENVAVSQGKANKANYDASASTKQMADMAAYWNNQQKAIDLANGVVSNSTLKAADAADKFMFKLQQMADKAGMSSIEMLKLQAAQHGVAEGAIPLIDKIEAAATATNHHGLSMSSNIAKMEVMRVAHDAAIGSYTRMGSAMMVLGERTGAAALLFSGLGLAILAAAGAFIGFAVAVAKGAMESAELNKQMKLTGDYAGITEGQFNSMAQSMATGSKTGIGAAREMLQALAATGQFSGATLTIAGQTALDFAKLSGMSADDVVKDFEKMSDGVAAWAESHNKHYHFLTAAQYDHIATLEKEGKAEEAMQVTMAAFDDHAKKNADNLGALQTAWHATGEALSSFWDVLKGIGRDTTVEQKVASAQQQLKNAQANLSALGGAGQDSDNARKIKATIDEAAANLLIYKTQQDLQESDKRDLALQDQLHAKAIQAVKDHQSIVDSLKTRAQQGEDAVKKYIAGQQAIVAEGTMTADNEKTRLATMAGIREQYAEKEVAEKLTDFQKLSRLINEKIAAQDMELASDTKLSEGQKLAAKFAADLRDGVIKLSDSEKLRATNLLETLIADEKANQAKIDAKKSYDELIKSIEKAGDAGLKRLEASIAKQREHNAEIGKTKEQIERVKQAAEDAGTAQMADEALAIDNLLKENGLNDQARAIYAAMLGDLNNQIAARKELSALQGAGASIEGGIADQKAQAAESIKLWTDAGKSIGDALSKGFNAGGVALGGMLKAFTSFTADRIKQDQAYETQRANLAQRGLDGDTSAFDELQKLSEKNDKKRVEDTLGMYGSMAGAAAGFFDSQSTAYKVLMGIEKAMYAVRLVMQAEDLAATVAGNAVKDASNEASTIISIISGAAQMFAQSGWSGFAGVAAMIAVIASLGGSSGGSVSAMTMPTMGASAADNQKLQGAGGVLGDSSAKSESISKSISLLAANSDITLTQTNSMLTALYAIRDSLGGMASAIAKSTGLLGGVNDTAGLGLGSSKGFLGIGSTSTSLIDQGIVFGTNRTTTSMQPTYGYNQDTGAYDITQQMVTGTTRGPQTYGDARANGVGAQGFSTTESTNSGLWGLFSSDETKQVFKALDATVQKQLNLTVNSIADGVESAGKALGLGGKQLHDAISNANIDIQLLSLKGLTGQGLTDAINAVFSKAADSLATEVTPGLDDFMQVGEGYFQTLVRVSTGIETAGSALDKFGITAIKYTDIINKQGDIGTEIFRQSVTGHEVTGAGDTTGIGKIIAGFTGSLTDMAALYTQLVAVRDVLKSFNASLQDVTIDMIKGAGSLADLQKGIATYYDKYFTEQEKVDAGMADMTAKFAALGVPLPATTDAFRSLVSGLDMTSTSGQDLYGKLMALAGGFYDASTAAAAATAATAAAAAQLADSKTALQIQLLQAQGDTTGATALTRQQQLAKMSDAGLITLQQQVWAAQDKAAADALLAQQQASAQAAATAAASQAAQAAQQLVSAWQSVTDTIFAEVKRIRGLVGGNGIQSFASAQAQFAIATGQARAGDQDAAKLLPGLSQALLTLAASNATTSIELSRIQALTANSLADTGATLASKFGLKLPGFAVGTNYVTHDMAAMVHAGEEITPRPFVDTQRAARDETNTLLRKLTETNDTMKTELVNVKAELVQIKGTNLRISQITEKSDAIGPRRRGLHCEFR